jgi:hypothetical protein
MTFGDCVRGALDTPEFLQQWARLRGIKLTGNPLDTAIDKATGYDGHIARTFLADVYDLIYLRVTR